MEINEILMPASGRQAPARFSLQGGYTEIEADPKDAARVSAVVLSLLYPATSPPLYAVALAERSVRSKWSLTGTIGKRRFRVTRRALPSSVVLELAGEDSDFKRTHRGAESVERALAKALILPPLSLARLLFYSDSDAMLPPKSKDEEDDGLGLMSNEDFLGGFDDEEDETLANITPEVREALSRRYRNTYARETLTDFLDALKRASDETDAAIAGLVDDTGEFSSLTKALSELPQIRTLREEDEALLRDGAARLKVLEAKGNRIEEAFAKLTSRRSGPLLKDPLFVGGIALAAVFTAMSFVSVGMRTIALGNVFVLAASLVGVLRHLVDLEERDVDAARSSAIARSQEKTRREAETLTLQLHDLTAKLGVDSFDEYLSIKRERQALERQLKSLEAEYGDVLNTPQYKQLDARRVRIREGIRAMEGVLEQYPATEQPAYELATDLGGMGLQPSRVIWQDPTLDSGESGVVIKGLLEGASHFGLWEGGWTNAKIPALWERLCGELVSGQLSLSAAGEVLLDGDPGGFERLGAPQQHLITDMLRLAIVLNVSRTERTRMGDVMVRTLPYQQANMKTRPVLERAYQKLGTRVQVILSVEQTL